MPNIVLFGSLVDDLDLEEDDARAILAEPVHSVGDSAAGLVLARLYGFRGGNVCVSFDKPILTWMPSISVIADDCGYVAPLRSWSVQDDVLKAATASPLDTKKDGIFISIDDFRVDDGWFVGTVRLKAVAAGIKLLDVGIPFKTKSGVTLVDTTIAGFKLKALLSVESANPPRVCVTVTIKGPLGYKDKKRVCT